MTSRGPAIARGVVLQTAARGAALPVSLLTLALATRYLGQIHGFWRHHDAFDAAEPLTRQVAGFVQHLLER